MHLKCSLRIDYRILICCTCYFQSNSLFFVYFGFLFCKSLQCLISALTQRGKGGPLFRLTCSVVLWGGRTMKTNITGMCGECSQSIDHTGFSPAHDLCFPGLHYSGSRVLCRGTIQTRPCISCISPDLSFSVSGSWVLHKGID